MQLHTETYKTDIRATTTPPADMVEAARKSLTAKGFEALMRETAGRPTAAELVDYVERERR